MIQTLIATRGTAMLKFNVRALEAAMLHLRYNTVNLSIAAGIHRNTLMNIMDGKAQPSLSTISKLANVLGVSPYALIEDVADEEETDAREKRWRGRFDRPLARRTHQS